MFSFFKKRKSEIKAVSNKEIESYLKSLGLLDSISSGKKRCSSCGDILDIDSVQAIIPKENEIKILCNKSSCVKKIENGFS